MDRHALGEYLQPGETLLEVTRPAMSPTVMQVCKVLFWGTLAATFLWSQTRSFPLALLYGLGLAALIVVGPGGVRALGVVVGVTDRRVLVLQHFLGRTLSQVDIAALDTVELDVGVLEDRLGLGTVRLSGPGVTLLFERIVQPKRLVDAYYRVRQRPDSGGGVRG